MAKIQEPPWSDTPATSERIVSAISRIAATLRSGAWQFATAQGLNRTQVEILELLLLRSEGVRVSWIAGQMGVSSASASDSIASLSDKGLVKKGGAHDDGRALALRLTPSGRALAKKVAESMGFAFDAVDRLPDATQQALLTSLMALIGKLQQAERFPEIRACFSCQHFAPNTHRNAKAPHHCRLVDAALSPSLLRIDCAEHEQADAATTSNNLKEIEFV